ncbi:MAG: hypothetical protein PWQ08_198 [Clostridiales bacterium]|jgi:hypothetical protein|nr:hypothetical protein [Clostridiales bacterium]
MAGQKPQFNKDYVFNLIMPSAPVQPQQPTEPQPAQPVDTEAKPVEENDTLSLLRKRLLAQPEGMRLGTPKEMVLVNLDEQLVADRLDAVFEKFNCCRCNKCKQDAAALALNMLPPHYVVATPDELPALLEECPTKEVSAALIKAILQVKNHPMH